MSRFASTLELVTLHRGQHTRRLFTAITEMRAFGHIHRKRGL